MEPSQQLARKGSFTPVTKIPTGFVNKSMRISKEVRYNVCLTPRGYDRESVQGQIPLTKTHADLFARRLQVQQAIDDEAALDAARVKAQQKAARCAFTQHKPLSRNTGLFLFPHFTV